MGAAENHEMDNSGSADVTQMLAAAAAGDESAAVRLLPLVYDELRKLAGARMRRTPPGQTLQATALVHEAYLRVVGEHDRLWAGRGHFFFAAARAMRDILVDQARRKSAAKRGGERRRIQLEDIPIAIDPPNEDILALNEVLRRLEVDDPEGYRVVLLRYFTGLTGDETAEVMGVSSATIDRKWRYLRAWLRRELRSPS